MWLECNIKLSDTLTPHKRWSFDNILLTDYWKQEIADYFKNNDTISISRSVLWDAMKGVVHGKASSASAAMRKQRKEQQKQITDNNLRFEKLHKQRGGKKLYDELMAEHRALELLDTNQIQKNLLYLKQRSWRNSPKAI